MPRHSSSASMMSHFAHTLCPLPILLYLRTLDNEKLFYHRFFRSALATFLHVDGVDGGVRAYTPYQYQQRDFFLSIKYLTTQSYLMIFIQQKQRQQRTVVISFTCNRFQSSTTENNNYDHLH